MTEADRSPPRATRESLMALADLVEGATRHARAVLAEAVVLVEADRAAAARVVDPASTHEVHGGVA